MIINSRGSNFLFIFPKGFYQKEVIDKYTNYIRRQAIPYDTLDTYMAATVQSVSFPGLNMSEVSQVRRLGKMQDYKNSVPVPDLFDRSITVTFRCLDGYINYWIFLENALLWLDFDSQEEYIEDLLQMRFLDQEGRNVLTCRFEKPLLTAVSGLNMSYSDNNPDYKTFNATFKFYKMTLFIDKD